MIDLPPWAQTALTVAGLGALVALLAMPHVGVALLRRNRASVWGLRFVSWGVAGREALTKAADILSPRARRNLESFPEAEVPSGVDATVRVEAGGSLTVDAAPGAPVVVTRKPPPLLLLCLALLALTGCADLTWARSIRDASHDAAVLAAPVVERRCVAQAESDLAVIRAEADPAKRERLAEEAQALLRARRCTETVTAYDALRVASITLDATVAAAESGQCMSARSEGCDVGGAAVKAAQATAAVASFVRVLEAGK